MKQLIHEVCKLRNILRSVYKAWIWKQLHHHVPITIYNPTHGLMMHFNISSNLNVYRYWFHCYTVYALIPLQNIKNCCHSFIVLITASQMVGKLWFFMYEIFVHPTSLPYYVIGLASLFLACRVPQMKIYLQKISPHGKHSKVLLVSIHGLVGKQLLKSHSKSGISGCLLRSARSKIIIWSITWYIKIHVLLQQWNAVPNQG